LNVTNGGLVELYNTVFVGDLAGSQGTVVVDGNPPSIRTSVLRVNDADIYIGSGSSGTSGSGRLTVSNDASLVADTLHIGEFTGTGRLTVVSGGDVFLSEEAHVGLYGTLEGDSYIATSRVRNSGLVHPSTSPTDPGALTVSGNYEQFAGAALQISLASASDYSQLNAASMNLAGTLYVETLSGFVPVQGEVFQILNSSNISGTFSFLQLPALNPGLYWYTNDLYTNGTIRVAGNGVDGDFTSDGYVDAADYVMWRKTGGPPADYNTWRTNFGQASGAGSAAQSAIVPEPFTNSVIMIAIVFGPVRPTRRVRRSFGDV
jgi:hypothetical protein